jgi:hypothetical protein
VSNAQTVPENGLTHHASETIITLISRQQHGLRKKALRKLINKPGFCVAKMKSPALSEPVESTLQNACWKRSDSYRICRGLGLLINF